MMKHSLFRYLPMLALAGLLCGTAGAIRQTNPEQVPLSDDEITLQADTIERKEIDGKQMLLKTFVLSPETDPALLHESSFEEDRYKFVYDHIEKTVTISEDRKNVAETFAMETSAKDMETMITEFPATYSYNKDGYTGILTLDAKSIKTETVKSGCRAIAVYRGQVSKAITDSVKYTVCYIGEEIPVPGSPEDIEQRIRSSPLAFIMFIFIGMIILCFVFG